MLSDWLIVIFYSPPCAQHNPAAACFDSVFSRSPVHSSATTPHKGSGKTREEGNLSISILIWMLYWNEMWHFFKKSSSFLRYFFCLDSLKTYTVLLGKSRTEAYMLRQQPHPLKSQKDTTLFCANRISGAKQCQLGPTQIIPTWIHPNNANFDLPKQCQYELSQLEQNKT